MIEGTNLSNLSERDVPLLNPLQLAFIGDAVYEVFIRSYLLSKKVKVDELHKRCVEYVKASSQADLLNKIENILTPEEKEIIRRGRNTRTNHVPKSSCVLEYRRATALEALIGYLYLLNRNDRINEIMKLIIEG